MKRFEKTAGIIILISSVVILVTFFLPAFRSDFFTDALNPNIIAFGKAYDTTLNNAEKTPFLSKFYAYYPLFITYVITVIPAGAFWLIQLFRVNKPIRYVVYFITLMSFCISILFFITATNEASFIRTDVANPAVLQIKNLGFSPTIFGILTIVFGAIGAISSGSVLVKDIIKDN